MQHTAKNSFHANSQKLSQASFIHSEKNILFYSFLFYCFYYNYNT